MALTVKQIENFKPKDKDYKASDEKSLYLLVKKNGGKYWRMNYRWGDKQKTLALGVYPEISLREARDERDEARKLIRNNVDPSTLKRSMRDARKDAAENSFEAIGREWLAKEQDSWSPAHAKKQYWLLEKNLFPYIGRHPISEITPPTLLAALRKTESRGALETTRRVKQVAGQIFRYAVATGRCERDPSADLKGALQTPQTVHYAAITEPADVGKLLTMIDGYSGTATVRNALLLAPLVFVRPGELRYMEWSEVDFEERQWRLPAEKMKMKQAHIVPLSNQAIEILQDQHELSGRWQYVFPSERSKKRAMSENALNAALRRMGIAKEEMTAHGFRAMARTLLDEQLGFPPHIIEHQLAHDVRDPLGRAYNRTKHLPERIEMMQKWADYLDNLRGLAKSDNVIILEPKGEISL